MKFLQTSVNNSLCPSAVTSPLNSPLTGELETNFNVVLLPSEVEWYLHAPLETFNLTPCKWANQMKCLIFRGQFDFLWLSENVSKETAEFFIFVDV